MTPTLIGRWQTRIAMLAVLGTAISLLFVHAYDGGAFFRVLGYVALFGLGWDVIFIVLQRMRWDRDWPAVFQFAAGLVEAVVLFAVLESVGLPGVPRAVVPADVFAAHYGAVWCVTFAWVQGPMRALFPLWRFHGGRII